MSGKLIFVSGLSGAGKTTLIEYALKNIANLECLLTYTTRPRRNGEDTSYEYIFVNDEEYELLKNKSGNWDETIYNGYKYASDADKFNEDLARGVHVIVSVTPNVDDIRLMAGFYNVKPITIWIDTSVNVAAERLGNDTDRLTRVENESVKDSFDILFKPSHRLDEDGANFVGLVRDIIEDKVIQRT